MLTLVTLSCLLLSVSGYNFEDVFYNEILTADFEFLADDSDKVTSYSRTRRDLEDFKYQRHVAFCCGSRQIRRSHHNELKAVEQKCFEEVNGNNTLNRFFYPFSCEALEKHKTSIICIQQCIAQQTGIADPSGNLKEDAVKKSVTEHNTIEWLKPKLDGIVTKCLIEAKNGTGIMKNPDKTSSCNPAAVNFAHCMIMDVQSACPPDQIKNPQICKQFLETFGKKQ